MAKEIPPGSGIHGRPILHDVQPGIRHLAHLTDGRHYVTWCGLDVPDDHMCPSREQVARTWPFVILNCYTCHGRWQQEWDNQPVQINGYHWLAHV